MWKPNILYYLLFTYVYTCQILSTEDQFNLVAIHSYINQWKTEYELKQNKKGK